MINKRTKFLTGLLLLSASFLVYKNYPTPNDLTTNAVMIVNKAQNHGGTGIVVQSTDKGSYILTNDHVCKAVSSGGVVKSTTATSQIESYFPSQVSDLCLVYVATNLKINTTLAGKEPAPFAEAKISGHPALLPTVITTGHFSDRNIIQVVTGFKDCTEEDLNDPSKVLLCAFLGGLPVVKSYESILVTATIMPGSSGSSGSGVYNSKDQLSGVVFAGQGDFGYAWTVPFDQVYQFVNVEAKNGRFININQEINLFGEKESAKNIREVLKKCETVTNNELLDTPEKVESIQNVCQLIKKDMMWVK